MQGFGTALGEPAVVGAGDGADGVLQKLEFLCECGVVRGEDEGAHDDVGVAVDVFGEAVQDDVGAEEEGGGVEGGEERVVHEDERVGGV